MNLTCDTVMDLFPLYYDGLASQSSREAIRRHLRTCPSCREFVNRYRETASHPAPCGSESLPDFDQGYRNLADRLKRRHIIKTSAFSFVLAVCLATLAASFFLKRNGR